MATLTTECAPAKLNLDLRVLGRRRDGYHLIESIVVPISLCDTVEVRLGSLSRTVVSVNLTVRGNVRGVPRGATNLATRAARAFFDAVGGGGTVHIVLHKAIPAASGLGGGSSDAAAVLRALASIHPGAPAPRTLTDVAAELGADVPFFLRGVPARVRGIGEIVRPFRARVPPWYVLALPRTGVSTRDAYMRVRLTRKDATSKVGRFRYSVSHSVNDLEEAVLPDRPDIGRLKEKLLDVGAEMALMSGSGSAVFGCFRSLRQAERAAADMPRGVRVVVVRSLAELPSVRRPAGR